MRTVNLFRMAAFGEGDLMRVRHFFDTCTLLQIGFMLQGARPDGSGALEWSERQENHFLFSLFLWVKTVPLAVSSNQCN